MPNHFPSSRALLFGSALLLACVHAPTAKACSVAVTIVQLAGSEIPFDGVLLGRLVSCSDCEPSDVRVIDAQTGAEVIGMVQALPHTSSGFVFRPATPLTVGKSYRVELADVEQWQAPSFSAIARPAIPAINVTAGVDKVTRGAGQVHCASYDQGATIGFCDVPFFYEGTRTGAVISVAVAGADANQSSYRIAWSADGKAIASASGLLGVGPFSHELFEAAQQVCYELFAVAPEGGAETRLSGECYPVDPTWFGTNDADSGDVTGTLQACMRPPEGYREAWCKVHATGACFSSACRNARAMCSTDGGVPPPRPSDVEGPYDPSWSDDGDADVKEADRGCSVTSNQKRASAAVMLLMASFLLCVRRRRRSSRG